MNWDWTLSSVKRALLTILVTLALIATITREHLMAYMWTVVGLVIVIVVLQIVDALRKDRAVTPPRQDAKVH